MRVLFDQGTPVPLRKALTGHTVNTTFEMGWAELANGQLLDAAEAAFDVLVTTDQNLRHQQNLGGRQLAILVLPTTRCIAGAFALTSRRTLRSLRESFLIPGSSGLGRRK